jgi:prepilin-type N-terminal cleavage/methylation domain-containing protein
MFEAAKTVYTCKWGRAFLNTTLSCPTKTRDGFEFSEPSIAVRSCVDRNISQDIIIRKRRGKSGFTLVEVIVVLVILAILAAIAIPALTGYIDKANEKKMISEARSSVTAIQTWASEQYANGKTGNSGLKDGNGGPVSIASYNLLSNGDTGAIAADFGLAPFGGAASVDKTDVPFYESGEYGKAELIYTIVYNYLGEQGEVVIKPKPTYSITVRATKINNPMNIVTFDLLAAGSGTHAIPGTGTTKFSPPALPEGYMPRADTKALIDSGASMTSNEVTRAGSTPGDDYNSPVLYSMDFTVNLYYVPITEENEPTAEPEQNIIPNASSTGWLKIVDGLAGTKLEADGYVISGVQFSDQNTLNHMVLSAPAGGDFAVYSDGKYYFNEDPGAGTST